MATGAQAKHPRDAALLDDWLKILEQALENIPRIFILIDGDLLSQATKNDQHETVILTEFLRTKLATSVKVLVPASNLDREHIDTLRLQSDCVSLVIDSHAVRGRQSRSSRGKKRKMDAMKRRPVSYWMTGYAAKRQRV